MNESSNNLLSEECEILIQSISLMKNLEFLDLSTNYIGSIILKLSINTLTHLNLSNIQFDDYFFQLFCSNFCLYRNLQFLNISKNPIANHDSLYENILELKSLIEICIDNYDPALFEVLHRSNSKIVVDCEEDGTTIIVKSVNHLANIKRVQIASSLFDDVQPFEKIRLNNIQHLSIDFTAEVKISPEELSQIFSKCTKLKSLESKITNQNSLLYTAAIIESKKLEKFSILVQRLFLYF